MDSDQINSATERVRSSSAAESLLYGPVVDFPLTAHYAVIHGAGQGNVALLAAVQEEERIADAAGVEAALHQSKLLLLEGAGHLQRLLQSNEERSGV